MRRAYSELVMKFSLLRFFAATAVFLATAGLAQAHPGHDGHDLTWDFAHLGAHPGATLLCFGVVASAVWLVWKLTRPADESAKAIRVRADESRRER
jgi:hypothetical protein